MGVWKKYIKEEGWPYRESAEGEFKASTQYDLEPLEKSLHNFLLK